MRFCGVCGKTNNPSTGQYFIFRELKSIYMVGFPLLCTSCGDHADKFVNYYGQKSDKDKSDLHAFLISGVAPMRDYSALVNAGYY